MSETMILPGIAGASHPVAGPLTLPAGCPKLSEALALARDRCKAAAKTGRNTFHNYAYAPADEIIETASVALAGSGLALIPASEELTVVGTSSMAFYALNRVLYLAHSSGEFVILETKGWPVIPEKGRPLDKAYAIALTTSLSYKLRDLLQMPRGTADDVNARDDRAAEPAPVPTQTNHHAVPATAPTPHPVPEGNAQMPAPAQAPAVITAEQRQALLEVIQAKGRTLNEVVRMLAASGLKMLDHLPQSLLSWAMTILTDGQVGPAQLDRISALLPPASETDARYWERLTARLREKYGVDRLAMLSAPQADELEQTLLAKRQSSVTAAASRAASSVTL